jgi:hypothetical protein
METVCVAGIWRDALQKLGALRYFLCKFVACYPTVNVKNVVALARGYYSTLDKVRGYSSSETARGTPILFGKNVNN